MSAERNNDNKEEIAGGCHFRMVEMMGGCCPNGPTDPDCLTWMEEMGIFWSQEIREPAKK